MALTIVAHSSLRVNVSTYSMGSNTATTTINHPSLKMDGNDLPSPEKFLFEDNDGADVFNSEALVVCEDDNPSAPMS